MQYFNHHHKSPLQQIIIIINRNKKITLLYVFNVVVFQSDTCPDAKVILLFLIGTEAAAN